ncbi:MAG: hypothetical protein AAFY48_16665, partial [Bacteroidota bacterium]
GQWTTTSRNAFLYATEIWREYLSSPVRIRIQVQESVSTGGGPLPARKLYVNEEIFRANWIYVCGYANVSYTFSSIGYDWTSLRLYLKTKAQEKER